MPVDLELADRTLMGHTASKDQQLADHYFGSIPRRVTCFMKDFECEAHKLGIPLKHVITKLLPTSLSALLFLRK